MGGGRWVGRRWEEVRRLGGEEMCSIIYGVSVSPTYLTL